MRLSLRSVPDRHRPAALAVAALLAVVTDWQWLAGPRCAALVAARARLSSQRLELAAARREVAARSDTKQAVRDAARALRRAAMRLPDRRELAALLAEVGRSARASGLQLLLLRPKAERAAADHVEVPVELQLRGTFPQTVGFVRRLGALARLVRLGDLRLERPERVGEHVVVRAACTALTYRMLGDQERTATQQPRGGHG